MNPRRLILENVGTIALCAALAGSLALNVYFIRRPAPARAGLGGIKINTAAPSLSVFTLDGAKTNLTFENGARSTLIYVMSPTCGWCVRNYENILALAAATRGSYEQIGISIGGSVEDVRKHLEKKPLPFEVYVIDADKPEQAPFLRATPTTVVVARDGKIAQAWMGAFEGDRQTSVERFFATTLPGLQTAAVTSK